MEKIADKRLELRSIDACKKLGRHLSRHLARGHLLTLQGDLGVGKTTLARSIITTQLNEDGRSEAIPSPTFSLVQIYETRSLILTHADLYRIDNDSALRELNLDGALEEGALLVEWPRFLDERLLPVARLDILLFYGPTVDKNPEERWVELKGTGIWADKIFDATTGPLSGMVNSQATNQGHPGP